MKRIIATERTIGSAQMAEHLSTTHLKTQNFNDQTESGAGSAVPLSRKWRCKKWLSSDCKVIGGSLEIFDANTKYKLKNFYLKNGSIPSIR
ncbi:hypothetical protein [Sulfitobacter sp. JL08]|uniref:hypothetical protein n=1 Tax=Sulfitobacter sp. JL08 TaxID=2070369 RepID=UPI0020C7C016|nr:hypothetical protein [Sulfitobacter sp. JL08]